LFLDEAKNADIALAIWVGFASQKRLCKKVFLTA